MSLVSIFLHKVRTSTVQTWIHGIARYHLALQVEIGVDGQEQRIFPSKQSNLIVSYALSCVKGGDELTDWACPPPNCLEGCAQGADTLDRQ